MDDLFLIIFMLSSLAIVIFALLAIIQFVKKNRVKGKKQLKLTGIAFIATFISIIGFGVTMDSTEGKEEDKITTSTEENDADKTKEIAFYNNEFSPAIDSVQKEYGRIWNDLWTTTFNCVSEGNVDVYTAYKHQRLWKLIIEY